MLYRNITYFRVQSSLKISSRINQSKPFIHSPNLEPFPRQNRPKQSGPMMHFFQGIPYRSLSSDEDGEAESTKERYFLDGDDAVSNDSDSDIDIGKRRRSSFRQQLRPRSSVIIIIIIASLALFFFLGFWAAWSWMQPQTLQKCLEQTSAYCQFSTFSHYAPRGR